MGRGGDGVGAEPGGEGEGRGGWSARRGFGARRHRAGPVAKTRRLQVPRVEAVFFLKIPPGLGLEVGGPQPWALRPGRGEMVPHG